MVGADEMSSPRPGDTFWNALIIGCTIAGTILMIGWLVWVILL